MRRLGPCLLSAALALATASARAAEDDLPSGNEAPRLVPVVVTDGYYAYHDTSPGQGGSATLMTTANHHGEFSVNLVALGARLEHARITGAVVLQAGDSVDALYGNARGKPEVFKHVQLAHVGYRTGDWHVEAGVLPSLLGRESFVSTDNWSYTRALVADLTPYFVAGARVTLRVTPTLTANATVFNGWDTFGDRNGSKSGHVRLAWAPSARLAIESSTVAGREQVPVAGDQPSTRVFEDVVASYEVHPRVHLALELWGSKELDYRIEDPLKGDKKQAAYVRSPVSFGGALHAKWRFGETVYLAGRAEALADDAGVLAGNGARAAWEPVNGEPFIGQRLAAGTLTFGWQPHKSLLMRVEGVHRVANHPYFAGARSEYVETPAVTETARTFQTVARTSSTTFVASAAFAF